MGATEGFLTFLFVTVALLVFVVWSGLRARRKVHLTTVAITVVTLATAIYYAEKLGELYDLDAAGAITPIHLTIAKATTLSYLVTVAFGFLTLRNPLLRRRHRAIAFFTLGLTLLAFVTGSWMILAAEKL